MYDLLKPVNKFELAESNPRHYLQTMSDLTLRKMNELKGVTCQKSATVAGRGPWVAMYAGFRGSWSICESRVTKTSSGTGQKRGR